MNPISTTELEVIASGCQAITTYKIPASNFKGARIKARCESGYSVTLSWDNDLTEEGNHKKATAALCKRMRWGGTIVGGCDARGMVWVFTK